MMELCDKLRYFNSRNRKNSLGKSTILLRFRFILVNFSSNPISLGSVVNALS